MWWTLAVILTGHGLLGFGIWGGSAFLWKAEKASRAGLYQTQLVYTCAALWACGASVVAIGELLQVAL